MSGVILLALQEFLMIVKGKKQERVQLPMFTDGSWRKKRREEVGRNLAYILSKLQERVDVWTVKNLISWHACPGCHIIQPRHAKAFRESMIDVIELLRLSRNTGDSCWRKSIHWDQDTSHLYFVMSLGFAYVFIRELSLLYCCQDCFDGSLSSQFCLDFLIGSCSHFWQFLIQIQFLVNHRQHLYVLCSSNVVRNFGHANEC